MCALFHPKSFWATSERPLVMLRQAVSGSLRQAVVLSAHARRPTTLSLGKSLMTTGAIRAASTVANEKARATFDRLDEVLARGALFDFKSSPLPTPDEFFGLKPIKTVKGAGKQADGAPVTPAQEIAAAHAAVAAEKGATKGADDDFSQFRPRRRKGSADGLGKDGASEAPAVVVDHSSNTFEALYEGRTGYETDEEMAPVEDYNAPYRHTKHIRALLRAYDEKDLDAVLELYYGNKRDPLTMRAELEAAIAKQDEELSREVDGDDGDSLVTAGQNQTTKSELDDDARAVGPDYLEYDIVLDACAKAGRLDIAMSIVDDLVSEHGLPTPSVLTLLLKGAAIANDVNAAVRLWETFQSSGCALNADAYAAIIGVHMANGNSDEAFALFNKMKRSGIEPSEACFFFILDGLFARERYDLARHVWHTVTHTRQFKPKQEFYDMALTGFSKGGSLEDISAVYERMRRDKYGALTPSPNVAVACFQRFVAAASFDEATTLLVALHKAGTLTASNVDMKALEAIASKFPEKQQVLALKALKGTVTSDASARVATSQAPSTTAGPTEAPVAAVKEEEDTFFDRPAGSKKPSKAK